MTLRVVLYAEGAGELSGEWMPPAPGDLLREEHLGPGHVLCARAIEMSRGVDSRAVRFEQGLTKRGRIARGSELLDRKALLEVLVWPRQEMQPQLVVVLVDEDGVGGRYVSISEWVAGLIRGRPPVVVAVAKVEFESWLVTDRACVERVLGSPFSVDGDPETWAPRTAKAYLEQAFETAGRSKEARELRRSICVACDLETLRVGSRSFSRFLTDLGNAPVVVGR